MVNPDLQEKIAHLYSHRDERPYLNNLQQTINKYNTYLQYHIPFTKENVQFRINQKQINGLDVNVAFLNIYKQMMQHFKPQHFIWGFFSFVLNSIIYYKKSAMGPLTTLQQDIHKKIIKTLNKINKFSYQFYELQRDQTKTQKINNQSQVLMNQILEIIYVYYGSHFQLNTTDFIIDNRHLHKPIDFVDYNDITPQHFQNIIQSRIVQNPPTLVQRDTYNCQINIKRVETDILNSVFGMQKRPFQMIPDDKYFDEIVKQRTVVQNMTYQLNASQLENISPRLTDQCIQNLQNIRARFIFIKQNYKYYQRIWLGYSISSRLANCITIQPQGQPKIYKVPVEMNRGFFLYPNIQPMGFDGIEQDFMQELGDKSDMLFKYNFLVKQQIMTVPYKKLIAYFTNVTEQQYDKNIHDMINLIYKCVKNGEVNMDQLINYINLVLISVDNRKPDYEYGMINQFKIVKAQNVKLKYIQQLKNILQKNKTIYKFYELSSTDDLDQNQVILTYLFTLYVLISKIKINQVAVDESDVFICCGQLMSLLSKKIPFQEIEGLIKTADIGYNYNLKHKYMLLTSHALLGYQTPLDYLQYTGLNGLPVKISNQRKMLRFQMIIPHQNLILQSQNPPIQPVSVLQLLVPSVISISMSVLIILYRRRQILQEQQR